MKNILKNKTFWIMLGIMLVGAFLRLYHFDDWMHYQLDQARDYRIVHAAAEYGPGELPLQGPRAAGSFLRLGPLLYYLEYLSILVFEDTPAGSVLVIAILNILAIPLFYFFVRNIFEQKLSLGLTAMFSVSLFMVIYSRFGWNPNLVVFFMLLLFYALTRVSSDESNYNHLWLMVASVALVFLMNMHFITFVLAPVVVFVYLIWTRPHISKRWWFASLIVIIFLNTPLIVNDIKTGGENFREFVAVALDHTAKDDEKSTHSLKDKLMRNVALEGQYFWIVLTGNQEVRTDFLYKDIDVKKCDNVCRKGMIMGIVSLVVLSLSIILFGWKYYTRKNTKEVDTLKLLLLWSAGVFVIYIPLAFDTAPRFFLLLTPIFIVLLGVIFQFLLRYLKLPGLYLSALLIFILVVFNLFYDFEYFGQLSQSRENPDFRLPHKDYILKEKTRITFAQMMDIVDWIEEKYEQNKYPVFLHSQAEYKRALWERIDIRDIPRSYIPGDLNKLYREANYFIIIRSQSNQESFLKKYTDKMYIIDKKSFGTLTGYYLRPKPEFITAEKKTFDNKSRDPKFSQGVQPRYLWRQVFEGCTYNHKTDKCEK